MSLKKGKIMVFVIAALITCGLLLLFTKTGGSDFLHASENTDLAYRGRVEATDVKISAEIGGKIADLKVKEGQRVSRGEIIAELDQAAQRLQVEQAQAAMMVAEKNLAKIKALPRKQDIDTAAAQVEEAELTVAETARVLARVRSLYESGAATKSELDKTETEYNVSAAKLKEAKARLSLVESGPLPEEVAVAAEQVAQSAVELDMALNQLEKTVIKAPCDGVVYSVAAKVGEVVGNGSAIAVVSRQDDKWVKVFISEKDLSAFKLGQGVTVRTDALKEAFSGTVTYIAQRAEFINKQIETSEDREYMVFEVKISIDDPEDNLPVGLMVDVEI